MKTLVIHPNDRSTDFLKSIYCKLKNVTLIIENTSRDVLHELISSHDQIIMLGHGSPSGLFNVAGIGTGTFTISHFEVSLLRSKQCIFIWCHASDFVHHYNLKGLSSGMFISEVSEAQYYNVSGNQAQVNESNNVFAEALGNALAVTSDYHQVLKQVTHEYKHIVLENKIAQYNLERWQLID